MAIEQQHNVSFLSKKGGGGGSRFLQNIVSYVHMTVHHNKLLFNETNRRTHFQIYSCTKL